MATITDAVTLAEVFVSIKEKIQ